jgi:uncharacterized RDD family membrane protein YckC
VQADVPQEHTAYAGLSWRFAATVVDTAAIFFCMLVLMAAAAAIGALELPDPNTTNPFDFEATRATMPTWLYFATYGVLFAYYALLEGLIGASLGKLAFGLRVRMDDGRPATPTAIVVRNLIRIPEALFWYIPSGISCALSSQKKRLGDHAARTIVVRKTGAAPQAGSPAGRVVLNAAPPPSAAPVPAASGTSSSQASLPGPAASLAALKAAVLAARGAHDTFLRFSERELTKEPEAGGGEPHYSPEYVAAWYSLADAVHDMNEAWSAATAVCRHAGTTLDAAIAAQPDLVYLLRQLAPYLAEDAGEHLHEAYVAVVRSEARGRPGT